MEDKKILVPVKLFLMLIQMPNIVIPSAGGRTTPAHLRSGGDESYGLQDLAERVPRQVGEMLRVPFLGGIVKCLHGVLPGPPNFILINGKKNGVCDPDIYRVNRDSIRIFLLHIGGGCNFFPRFGGHVVLSPLIYICLLSYLKLSLSFYFSTFCFLLFSVIMLKQLEIIR